MIKIDLAGKSALITGGTRGIGRGISRRLAEAGANTLAIYHENESSAADSLAERQSFGSAVHRNLKADIGDETDVTRVVQATCSEFPDGFDYLILNAGIGLGGKVTEIDPAAWRHMFDVNLGSAFLLSRGLIPHMRRGGSIVAIGSGSGHDPIPDLAFYGAAKAGLVMFIADLAQEVGPLGIRANVVSPGGTDAGNTGDSPDPAEVHGSAQHNALGRRGVPDDVAGAVVFFCCNLSSFITGQAVRVNGGAI